MQTNIIKIGNSKGIILPTDVLRKLRLTLKSAVTITIEGDAIIIKKQPRQGWAEAALQAHNNGDDQLIVPDVFPDENMKEWQW